eukprot:TRINITY_DN8790_c0_g1_i2.p1 TRINITY_DN8790_c0_g1~~TRINITY_DN8790_c0_g1_i2.p1  ORF type:complete len:106 (+),score=10.30 TRINITY_DN8790_c0_g1_i2:139-456(+)
MRLFCEHLGEDFEAMEGNHCFEVGFQTFKTQGTQNLQSLKEGLLSGRPVLMAPAENYDFLLKKVYSSSQATQFLTRLGLHPSDLQQLCVTATSATTDFLKRHAKL